MKRKEVRFREEHESDYGLAYLKPFQEKFPDKPFFEILELIFKEHETYKALAEDRTIFVDMITKNLEKKLRIIELRAGYADKNARIGLELWNGYLFSNNQDGYMSTEEHMTNPMRKAITTVERDIDKQRKRKLERDEKAKRKVEQAAQSDDVLLNIND